MITAQQTQKYQSIISLSVRELLKMISRIRAIVTGFDEKKSYMLAELKSFMMYYEYPVIFLTLNPVGSHSPISLFYAREKIDIFRFHSSIHFVNEHLRIMQKNPLAMIHNVINIIIETIFK